MKTAPIALIFVFLLGSPRVLPAATPSQTLDDTAAAYKKRGEPIEVADFEVRGVADADNAALELLKAADAIKVREPAWSAYDKLNNVTPPLNDQQVKILRAAVEQNIGAIAHVDAAMLRKGVDWQIKMKSPAIEILLPHLSPQRLLANYLLAHALLQHHDGKDAEAVADIKRLIFVSRSVDHQGFVVGHLVSLGIMSVATYTIELIAPDLQVGPAAPAASVQQVTEIVTLLLDNVPSRKGFHEALLSERMSHFDMARCLVDGRLKEDRLPQMTGQKDPIPHISPQNAATDGIMGMDYTTKLIQVFDDHTDWPSGSQAIPPWPAELLAQPQQHPLASLMFSSLQRPLLTHYRSETERKLMAAVLALRAYASTHDGKLPEHLDDLVPDLLPAVPDDPMALRQPIKYSAANKIVYSTGEDGQTSDGSEAKIPGARGTGRWQQVDAVVHLQRVAK